MSQTYCKAEMKFIDVTALEDSSVSVSDLTSMDNLELFAAEDVADCEDYGTLELNEFILDGSKTIISETPDDIAYFSDNQSRADCTFSTNPVLTVTFDEKHSSSGLTFYFIEEPPAQMQVSWYDEDNVKLMSVVAEPDKLIWILHEQVIDYTKIVVEFIKTKNPKRYIKLQYLLYGEYIVWAGEDIKEASLTEEVDCTGATISINTAKISLVDEEGIYDLSNQYGYWKSIQRKQPVRLTEYVDEEPIDVGKYYVDTFDYKNNVISFNLIDSIGLLDDYTFYDGTIYSNVTAKLIIQAIMETAGVSNYVLDESLEDIQLSGHLGVMSCRQALQMICFAIDAVVDDSRGENIIIAPANRTVSIVLDVDRKFNGTFDVKREEYISGVSIEFAKYSLNSETEEIYNDVLPSGTNKIVFNTPVKASSVTASAGSIVDVNTNYVVITMASEGVCVINGISYKDTNFTLLEAVELIEAGEKEKTKEYGTCTLYNPQVARAKLRSLLSYHQLRRKISLKFLINQEKVGNWINIKTLEGHTNTTLIEQQKIDLTGGFISQASCKGYSISVTDTYYAGTELYANDEGII